MAEPNLLGAKDRRFVRTSEKQHYLIVPASDPILLKAGERFVMGRDRHCNLEVQVSDVSRKHAEFQWEGDEDDVMTPVLCNIRNKYGSFVNGKRVEGKEPVRSGDEVMLGESFRITYLYTDEAGLQNEQRLRARNLTEQLELPPKESLTSSEELPALRGRSASVSGGDPTSRTRREPPPPPQRRSPPPRRPARRPPPAPAGAPRAEDLRRPQRPRKPGQSDSSLDWLENAGEEDQGGRQTRRQRPPLPPKRRPPGG